MVSRQEGFAKIPALDILLHAHRNPQLTSPGLRGEFCSEGDDGWNNAGWEMFWSWSITLWFTDFYIRSNPTTGPPERQDCIPQSQLFLPLSKTPSLCSPSWQQMLLIHFHKNILSFSHIPLQEIQSKSIPKGSRTASTILAMAQHKRNSMPGITRN